MKTTTSTAALLVFLRLVLGWTLLVEGLDKVFNPNWTSEPYLREATGPFASFFRWMAGDAVEDRLSVKPLGPSEDAARSSPRMPAALAQEWQAWFDSFVEHYQLNDQQRIEALARLAQRQEQTVRWMLQGKKKIQKSAPSAPPVDVEKTPAEWLEEYRRLQRQADEVRQKERPLFGRGADARLNAATAELNRLRAELLGEINAQSEEMRQTLALVLKPEEAKDLPSYPANPGWEFWKWGWMDWVNNTVKYGLTAAGACLLLGLFSRTASLAGALLLLLFFLARIPLPGAQPDIRAEGTYYYINKTFVEAMALLVLATVPTGRWLGIDGLFQLVRPGGRQVESAAEPAPVAASAAPLSEDLTSSAAGPDNGSESQAVSVQPAKGTSDGS